MREQIEKLLKKENKKLKKEIEKTILDICIRVAKRGDGAMFILGDELKDYEFSTNQHFKEFNILEDPKTTETLSLQDGCVWIDTKGMIKGYGIVITKIIPILNKGTRHASAFSVSKQGNKVFIVSEEERKVKLFKDGKIIMQIDALEKGVEKETAHTSDFLESIGVGSLTTIGVSVFAPQIGITLVPGILIFGSGYVFIKNLPLITERIKLFYKGK